MVYRIFKLMETPHITVDLDDGDETGTNDLRPSKKFKLNEEQAEGLVTQELKVTCKRINFVMEMD